MKLSEKLNLNMEIAYVPVAKLKDIQEMMGNWKENNKKLKTFSKLTTITTIISAMYFLYEKEDTMCLISVLSAFLFILGGLLASKSARVVYLLPILSIVVFSLVPAYFPAGVIRNFFMITVYIPGIITNWFAYKALYNYKNVYIPLTKRKGFPHFVFSTSDMYADKMYLKNKNNKTVAEKRVEASYNPFNNQERITDEEVARMNSLRYKELKLLKEDIEKSEYFKDKEIKYTVDKNKEYKYGKSVWGLELVFKHDEIETCSKEECRRLMRLWNTLKEEMFKNEVVMLLLLLMCVVFPIWGGVGFGCLVFFIPFITYIFGTNFIKLDQWWGVPVMIISLAALAGTATNLVSGGIYFCLVVYFVLSVLPRLIKWCFNLSIYKKLSKREGFPSFYESATDLYGDDMYIVEKQEPLKKLKKLEPIVMNIGYDEKEEDKAWNAFDYLDKDKDNSAYDDFEYYEQVYEARRKAEARENQKPNKDMGRKTNNED